MGGGGNLIKYVVYDILIIFYKDEYDLVINWLIIKLLSYLESYDIVN